MITRFVPRFNVAYNQQRMWMHFYRRPLCIMQPTLLRKPLLPAHIAKRFMATDYTNHPLMEKFQKNPQIMQRLMDFTQLLQSKGIDVTGKQPSFMQMMKIMNDPDIKESIRLLSQDIQAAGIQLDLQSIQELQASLNSMGLPTHEQPEQKKEEVQEHGRKRGVMNKVKGLFNKK
ncbi:MAG: hypothetical protein EXX96DRAFT_268948 [Benjaminiella poitrasii]|nr:MAG: hypothetical protein EXX96DRAFT_268948 [Benjaminiella poitrasii]